MHLLIATIKFRVHRAWFAVRDWLQSPLTLVSRVGIKTGDRVVDYGCGAGSYALPAADVVGPEGHVFAVDENPLAVRHVRQAANDRGVTNMTVIESDRALPIASQSIDVVLLFDVIHDVADRQGVLAELQRVLKPQGLLAVRDHHLRETRLRGLMERQGAFRFVSQRGGLHRFAPDRASPVAQAGQSRAGSG